MTDTEACYVYGIVPNGAEVPQGLSGIHDQDVRLAGDGELAVVVSKAAAEQPLGRRADLLAHSRVLDAFAGQGPVIPIRFGTVLPGQQAAVDEFLTPNRDRFTGLLEELHGRSQFTLRARYEESTVLAEVVTENSEIARLRDETRSRPETDTYASRVRLGELVSQALAAKREIDGQRVLEPLLSHALSYEVQESVGMDDLIDVAFLVEDDRRGSFEEAAEAVAQTMAGRARLRLLGPLAPYSFVSAG